MLLIVSIIITVIFIIGLVVSFNKNYDVLFIISLFGGIVSFVTTVMCIIFFIGAHVQHFKTCNKLKLEQQRAAIIYCLESGPESIVGLASDISEYNTTIMTGRLRQDNIWFSNITCDFYDELELIEVGSKE